MVMVPAIMSTACNPSVAITAVIPPLIVHIAAIANTRKRLAERSQSRISFTNTAPPYSTAYSKNI